MFAFELWREFKLSIAEIFCVFPRWTIVFCDKKVLIIDWVSKDDILKNSQNLGGSIKIMEVQEVSNWLPVDKKEMERDLEDILSENLGLDGFEWKFHYAINLFWKSPIIHKEMLKISKKVIKEHALNPRFINQDFKNISSVAIIKEALIKKWTDFNFIFWNDTVYFWNTIFVQDIYGYSNRDYGKERDMNIGMLPPKLAQMMLNLAPWEVVYDPFVGLGTVLIESIHMWNKKIFWSDLNERMVETSNANLDRLKQGFDFEKKIIFQNAKYIHEIKFISEVDCIVTEWYLWEVMTKSNINMERIEKQKTKLNDLYEWFFLWLKRLDFKWNIVISFPFWEINGKYFYFEEIYDKIKKYCIVNKLLPENMEFQETKSGSLLYKRDAQLVGREIFSLQLK